MSAALKAAQEQAREAVRDLKEVKLRLLGILESLPASTAEVAHLEEVDLKADLVTELRSVVQCVLKDSLEPAIGDLEDVARLPVPDPAEEEG